MTRHVLISSLLALATAVVLPAAQTGSAPATADQKAAPKTGSKVMTLTGCIQPGDTEHEVTFVDTRTNGGKPARYWLSGANLKQYLGKHVQITGGLVPSPNLAAQAGAVDPSAAATAGRGGAAAGTGTMVMQFRVRKVVPTQGSCPPATPPQP